MRANYSNGNIINVINLKKILRGILITILLTGTEFSPAAAQKKPTVKSLTQKVNKLEEEIKLNKGLLKKNEKDQIVTRNGLKLVRTQLDTRRKLVLSLDEKITYLNGEITSRGSEIESMEREVIRLKRKYAEMVYAAYKNHKLNNSIAFIFDSKDFNEATKRIDYMQRYNRMREETVGRIDSISMKLGLEVDEMELQKSDIQQTKATRKEEIKLLTVDETKYKRESKLLAEKEKKIANTIKQKEKEKKTAQAQLQKIIEDEARKAAAKARSAEERKRLKTLSGKFDQNKGKFPYPVQKGVIIDKYGKHPHPTQKYLTIDNKGVNIAAQRQAAVKSIFEGTVTRVIFINGLNNCIMIQHGEYFTVYSNLATVQVKGGDKVTRDQIIGHLPNTADSNDYFLHFEIWKNTNNLNPEKWLYR